MKLAELLKRITPLPWLEVTATDGDKWIGTKEGDDRITSYKVKVKSGRVLVRMTPATPRKKKPHAPHPLARFIRRNRRHVAQTQRVLRESWGLVLAEKLEFCIMEAIEFKLGCSHNRPRASLSR